MAPADKAAQAADTEAATKPAGRRRASKEFRREQLINTTIDTLARRGFAATTLADVADGAGLSRGIVNFHFESKDKLLIETLQFMSDEYTRHWKAALAEAGEAPAERLRTLVRADLDEAICNPRLVAAWFAFWGEATNRPAYQELCWARDDDFLAAVRTLCVELKELGGYSFDTGRIAWGIYSLQEGLWLRLMLGAGGFTRESAQATALEMLGTIFPEHFNHDGSLK